LPRQASGRSGLSTLAILPVLALVAGCADALGPEPMETTRVTGRIRYGTDPVRGGWVEFMPIQGTIGLMRSAPIRPDGTFSAEKVPVGEVAVGINAAPIPQRRLFDSLGTQILRRIPPGRSSTVEIDLLDELAAAQLRQAKADR
jgi:hypothetical protein